MVESGSLENCYTRKGIEGSNPSASATGKTPPLYGAVFWRYDDGRIRTAGRRLRREAGLEQSILR